MFNAAELLYIYKCRDTMVDDISSYAKHEDYIRFTNKRNTNELLKALDKLLQRKSTLVADNEANEEIARSIGITSKQVRNLHEDTYPKSRTVTILRLSDLVYTRVRKIRFPFSMYGYEVNSRLAAGIRHYDRINCKKEWLTYTKRIGEALSHVKEIKGKIYSKEGIGFKVKSGAWNLNQADWDNAAFCYHYFLILFWLALTSENENDKDRYDIKEEYDRLKDDGDDVTCFLIAMLRNWRYYSNSKHHTDHNVWTYFLELKLLINRANIQWISTPGERRNCEEMHDLVAEIKYIDIHAKYSDIFPKNMIHPFNLLGIVSRLRLENYYDDFYHRLTRTQNKYMDLDELKNDPFADGDFDNFIEYWRKKNPR